MKILVTGATGFLGSVLVPHLIEAFGSERVSAFVLPGDPLPETWSHQPIGLFRGDITDRRAVADACRGHSHVIHAAGLISYWKRDLPRLERINRDGTANVVAACLEARVARLVHVSSVGAIGFAPDGQPADEDMPFNWPPGFHYMQTKHAGQEIVERAIRGQKLPALILCPASIMGPGDANPETPHNQLYRRIYKGHGFGSFAGGLAIVDVRDLVDIIQKSLEMGQVGEIYIVSGANATYGEVLRAIGRFANRRVRPVPIPAPLLTVLGLAAEACSRFTGKRSLLTAAYGRLSGWRTFYSNEKSRRAFGHEYIPFEDTIRDGCTYFEEKFLKGGSETPISGRSS